jgi:hypothetical protein
MATSPVATSGAQDASVVADVTLVAPTTPPAAQAAEGVGAAASTIASAAVETPAVDPAPEAPEAPAAAPAAQETDRSCIAKFFAAIGRCITAFFRTLFCLDCCKASDTVTPPVADPASTTNETATTTELPAAAEVAVVAGAEPVVPAVVAQEVAVNA